MSNQKSLNYILKGTSKAINEVSGKFYVDCYVDEKDIKRLMCWETNINNYLKSKGVVK
jgi:hypothetical protein